jgi:dTDP-glucose 4,6-dehydratase
VTNLVIYGAAGFVGSILLRGAKLPADALTLVDQAPVRPAVLDRLSQAGIPIDVFRSPSLTRIAADNADVLLVLAGQTNVDEALTNPALAFEANMKIAIEAAEWWRKRAGLRLVYLSSDEVLGPSEVPLDEEAPLRPTQPYAASKAAAEIALRCFSESYDLELVIVRSCNLVGGEQRARKLIPTAVENLASGLPVPIFGDGLHRREYLAVEDLCEVISTAVAGGLPAGVYNCSSGTSLQTIEVVNIVAKSLGIEPTIAYVKDRLVHDRCYSMDASKLKQYGWKPKTSATDAIAAAAIEMKRSWENGEKLTRLLDGRNV